MLLISYIVAAALELATVITMGRLGQASLMWSYGFLLASSLLSIPVETSTTGEKMRAEMKSVGINIDCYDLWSNVLRSVVYVLVLTNLFNALGGAMVAYGIVMASLLLAVHKLK